MKDLVEAVLALPGMCESELARLKELADAVHVGSGPVGALAEDEASASKKREDIEPGLEDLALEGFAAAHPVADSFLLLPRDVNQHQAVVAEATSELDDVAASRFAVLTGWAGDHGRSCQLIADAPIKEHALQDVAGARGFLTNARGFPSPWSLEVALDAPGVVGDPIDMEGVPEASSKDNGRDVILVDIESDPEDSEMNGHGHRSFPHRPKAPYRSGTTPLRAAL